LTTNYHTTVTCKNINLVNNKLKLIYLSLVMESSIIFWYQVLAMVRIIRTSKGTCESVHTVTYLLTLLTEKKIINTYSTNTEQTKYGLQGI